MEESFRPLVAFVAMLWLSTMSPVRPLCADDAVGVARVTEDDSFVPPPAPIADEVIRGDRLDGNLAPGEAVLDQDETWTETMGDVADRYRRSLFDNTVCDWWRLQTVRYRARNQALSDRLFGGIGGSGRYGREYPPVGVYRLVYPVNPYFGHPQDRQVYAAPQSGVPMVVPMAPNVRYSYNYSRGIPSSRLTPIASVLPPR